MSRRDVIRAVPGVALVGTGIGSGSPDSGSDALTTQTTKFGTRGTSLQSTFPHTVKLAADDGASEDEFGTSVTVSDDGTTAIIGAPQKDNDNGAAYVFSRAGGTWSQQTKLPPEGGDHGNLFGHAVSVSGDGSTAVISAFYDNDTKGDGVGSVYVFSRTGESWSQQTKLTAGNGNEPYEFGSGVDISADGSTIAIGDRSGMNQYGFGGVTYVFSRTSDSWTQQAKLSARQGGNASRFGQSVSLSDDGSTVVIGAERDMHMSNPRTGAAYVFSRTDGAWSQQAKLRPNNGGDRDFFGHSVDLSSDGETAIIGSKWDDNPNGDNAGSVYVFSQTGESWSQQTKLTAEDGDENDRFGFAVSMSSDGETAIFGSVWDDDPNGEKAGAAYAYSRADGDWTQETKLAPDDGDSEDQFGYAVGLSSDGETAIIGASTDEDPNGDKAGAAYVFGQSGNAVASGTDSGGQTDSTESNDPSDSETAENQEPEAQNTDSEQVGDDGEETSETSGSGDGFGPLTALGGLGIGAYRYYQNSDCN